MISVSVSHAYPSLLRSGMAPQPCDSGAILAVFMTIGLMVVQWSADRNAANFSREYIAKKSKQNGAFFIVATYRCPLRFAIPIDTGRRVTCLGSLDSARFVLGN